MPTLYNFGNETIDLETLAAVKHAEDSGSYGLAKVRLTFVGGSDVVAYFGSGQFGLPLYVKKIKEYHEYLEKDSDFFIAVQAEVEKLKKEWSKISIKTYV